MLKSLSVEDRKDFGEDVKAHLAECTDRQVIHPEFKIDHVVLLHRGRKYSPEHIKEIEDKAYKRGLEEKKILGAKKLGPKASTSRIPEGKGGKKEVNTSLTDAQKQRPKMKFMTCLKKTAFIKVLRKELIKTGKKYHSGFQHLS